jgi:CRP/FNR family transcriptional regulator, anaerobic regulatory protein
VEPAFFFNYLSQFIAVSAQLRGVLEQKLSPLRIHRGEILHKTGAYCRRFYFVEKGLIRVFYTLDDKEVTTLFAAEQDWVTSVNSFYKDEPSQYTLQALEDTRLFYLTKTDLDDLYTRFPEMNQFGRMLITNYYIEQSERINTLTFMPAQKRYADFVEKHADLALRIPLGMLASYLGITQETLSRVRRPRTF